MQTWKSEKFLRPVPIMNASYITETIDQSGPCTIENLQYRLSKEGIYSRLNIEFTKADSISPKNDMLKKPLVVVMIFPFRVRVLNQSPNVLDKIHHAREGIIIHVIPPIDRNSSLKIIQFVIDLFNSIEPYH